MRALTTTRALGALAVLMAAACTGSGTDPAEVEARRVEERADREAEEAARADEDDATPEVDAVCVDEVPAWIEEWGLGDVDLGELCDAADRLSLAMLALDPAAPSFDVATGKAGDLGGLLGAGSYVVSVLEAPPEERAAAADVNARLALGLDYRAGEFADEAEHLRLVVGPDPAVVATPAEIRWELAPGIHLGLVVHRYGASMRVLRADADRWGVSDDDLFSQAMEQSMVAPPTWTGDVATVARNDFEADRRRDDALYLGVWALAPEQAFGPSEHGYLTAISSRTGFFVHRVQAGEGKAPVEAMVDQVLADHQGMAALGMQVSPDLFWIRGSSIVRGLEIDLAEQRMKLDGELAGVLGV